MATRLEGQPAVRRGLPRVAGGEPWPPADADAVRTGDPVAPQRDEPSAATSGRAVRRGLPRVAGGEPWPAPGMGAPTGSMDVDEPQAATEPSARKAPSSVSPEPARSTPGEVEVEAAPMAGIADARPLRRGLPRVVGGEPWPAEGLAPQARAAEPVSVTEATGRAEVAVRTGPRPPLPFTRTVWAGPSASTRPSALVEAEPPTTIAEKIRATPWTLGVSGLLGGASLLILATMVVFATRFVETMPLLQDFLATYPGEYPLPETAESGFPAWAQWTHFFNMFFMVLIIRTGLQVRRDKRPSVFWTPKWSKTGRGKISLSLWFHQSLDVLWLVNGVLFVFLLFATSHWMRIVPTSWDVFPNALSALIQYVSLDWPTENGWVNYNSLQQLMYFITVFVAAPLAAITGVRMSGLWPKNAKALNKAYPVEWARAVHYPVMLFFVVFIIIHVALVFATGALRNLNHMYAGADVVNWVGFVIFVGSMVLVVAAWIAARPTVLAPIARLSGKVTGR